MRSARVVVVVVVVARAAVSSCDACGPFAGAPRDGEGDCGDGAVCIDGYCTHTAGAAAHLPRP